MDTLQLLTGKLVHFNQIGDDYKIEDEDRKLRPATAAEARELKVQQFAERINRDEILCCDSSLVEALLEESRLHEGRGFYGEWDWDKVVNYSVYAGGWTVDQCEEWFRSRGLDLPEANSVVDWRRAVEESDPPEIFEWHRVTDWLAEKLEEVGECVLRNDYGDWYGRTTTGQSMLMDGVLQQVAATVIDAV